MSTKTFLAAACATVAVTVAGLATTATAKDNGKLKSDHFVGVPDAMTGANGNFAGINGGGRSWTIGEAEVTVKSSGKVEVEFEDLIIPSLNNSNPVASMAVAVTCTGFDRVVTRAVSAPFPVTIATPTDGGGDADAETTIALPDTCLAPAVFITNATGAAWFAVDAL